MNMITGYLGATEGIIKINGFDILAQPEDAKKCIGYLPELPPLYMDMTVEEYLLFAAELKKIPKEKRKPYVEDAMATTKITDMKGRLIKKSVQRIPAESRTGAGSLRLSGSYYLR